MHIRTETILIRLRIAPHYSGFRQLAMAVERARADESRLQAVEKEIFMPIAEQECIAWKTVERNIRTVSRLAWEHNPGYLQRMAGEELRKPPSAGKLIRMIYQETLNGNRVQK